MIKWDEVINNLAAEFIWSVILLIVVYVFKNPLLRVIKRIRPVIDSSIPHLDFHVVYKPTADLKSDITIKNSGGEPAYNVYVFLYVGFMDGSFSIKSLGDEGVRSGVLGKGESIRFKTRICYLTGAMSPVLMKYGLSSATWQVQTFERWYTLRLQGVTIGV